MLEQSELVKIFMSFLIGGGVVTATTIISERAGNLIGGILASVPSTTAISLLFIGVLLGADKAGMASMASLVSTGSFGVLSVLFVYLSRYGFFKSLFIAILGWGLINLFFLKFVPMENFIVSVCVFITAAFACILILSKCETTHLNAKILKMPHWAHSLRFAFGGTIIALAVLSGLIFGEMVGGVLGAFPAMAVSSVTILYVTKGMEYASDFLKSMYISAAFNMSCYLVAIYWLYPRFGLLWGTVIAYVVVMVVSFFIYKVKHKKV